MLEIENNMLFLQNLKMKYLNFIRFLLVSINMKYKTMINFTIEDGKIIPLRYLRS
jgi:hypothetical protein